MKIKDIHKDIERFLAEDCYCPGEIYDSTGFFFRVVEPDDDCEYLVTGKYEQHDVICVIWKDQILYFVISDNRICEAGRYDATENNKELIKDLLSGIDVSDRKFNEFKEGETEKALGEILGRADAVIER
jgi:hypothetical protein